MFDEAFIDAISCNNLCHRTLTLNMIYLIWICPTTDNKSNIGVYQIVVMKRICIVEWINSWEWLIWFWFCEWYGAGLNWNIFLAKQLFPETVKKILTDFCTSLKL